MIITDPFQGEGSSDGVSDQCVGTDTCSVATETEPDCLGPCEPGTHVNLDGIVWQETENGMLYQVKAGSVCVCGGGVGVHKARSDFVKAESVFDYLVLFSQGKCSRIILEMHV